MTALGGRCGTGQAGGAGTDDGNFLWRRGLFDDQFGFVTGTRIDQAGCQLAGEDVIETGLVAGDAGIDLVRPIGRGLVHEIGIGKERSGHRDHVGATRGENILGNFRRIDAVGRDQRNLDGTLEPFGYPHKSGAWHHRRDGRDARLVPADAGIDDRRSRRLNRLGQRDHLVPGAAAFDQVKHREAENDNEIGSDPGACCAYRFDGEADAILETTAPFVGSLVGLQRDELVDQIAF